MEYQLSGQSGRLDKVLVELTTNSRATVQKWIKDQLVLVNDQVEKANFVLKGTEIIKIIEVEEALPLNIEPEAMALDIVYEDDDVLVVNKPAGLVVHPSKGHINGTLVNGLLHYLQGNLSEGSDVTRPGIVHRIDKDTSGLMVVAKHNVAHQRLSEQLSDRTMGRNYVALVNGEMSVQKGAIELPLRRDPANRLRWQAHKDGKYALTHFEIMQVFPQATLVELSLATGRTHQIRVHLEYIGHPIVGDPVYRKGMNEMKGSLAKRQDGQFLHAYGLHFNHPMTGEAMSFTVPLPEKFEHVIQNLNR